MANQTQMQVDKYTQTQEKDNHCLAHCCPTNRKVDLTKAEACRKYRSDLYPILSPERVSDLLIISEGLANEWPLP